MSFDPLYFHERAVRKPSHESVDAMRDFLVAELDARDHAVESDEAGNVVATRGQNRPHYVLNTHIDTVPPHVPYERDGDVVRGRGACDAKGPLAALLAAFLDVDPDEFGGGRLTLAVTPDEETLSLGAAALDFDADGYVVGEPTGLDVCNAARGRFQGTVTLSGTAAHAAERDAGTNAVAGAEDALAAIRTFDENREAHESLGRPLLTPTTIEGGEATNQVPGECTITFDRRSVPPESVDDCLSQLEAHLDGLMPAGVSLSVSLLRPEMPAPEAFATDEDAAVVRRLQAASGGDLRPFGAATEASYFAADAPTVVFGPGVLADDDGPVAHATREYVDRTDVHRAAAAVTDAVSELLG